MNAFLASKYRGYRFVLACLEAIKDEVSNAIFYLKDGESHLES